MLTLISPSKTLDFSGKTARDFTHHDFMAQSEQLIALMKKFKAEEIGQLMDTSEKLSQLNWQRYRDFKTPFTAENSRQAIYAFQGDVYDGLKATDLTPKNIEYAQQHLRIISGLYGLLRPLDLIQPYRLEMGTKLANKSGKDLYKFWGNKITDNLNSLQAESRSKILVNLASEEYFKAVNKNILQGEIITPAFMEKKGNNYKMVSFFAKKARGMMAAFIIKNRIKTPDGLKDFTEEGYKFNPKLSSDLKLVFTR